MATSSLGITLIADGTQSGTWGDTTNTNWQYMEDAVAGVYGLNLSGGTTYTFGTALLARYAVINVTNAGGNSTISFPAVSKVYIISNNSGYSATLQVTGGGGGSVVVANTLTTLVYCDGTNFNSGITGFTGGNLSITGSITASGSITGASFTSPSGVPQFAGGATGQIPYQTAANTTAYTPTPTTGSYLSWNGSTYTWSTGSVTTAANLAGGSANSVPYQTSPGNTGFLTPSGSTPLTLQYNGSTLNWAAAGAVSSFSASGTGLTPSTPTTGAITLGGILNVANGGTGAASFASAGLLTTSTGAQLSGTNNFTGANNYSTAATIVMTGSSIGDQRIGVNYSTYSSGLSATALQLGTSGAGMYWDPAVGPGLEIITPGFGGNAKFINSGYNYQGNNNASWQTTSDVNIKTNIHPITGVLEKINALKPTHFEYKDKAGETRTGFIAQEFETVFPGHVTTEDAPEQYLQYLPEGTTTIKTLTMDLIPYLVKAVQELSAKIDAQAAEIATLKGA